MEEDTDTDASPPVRTRPDRKGLLFGLAFGLALVLLVALNMK
jgi:hypothetical protein